MTVPGGSGAGRIQQFGGLGGGCLLATGHGHLLGRKGQASRSVAAGAVSDEAYQIYLITKINQPTSIHWWAEGLPALGTVVSLLGLAPGVVLLGELHLEVHEGRDRYTAWVNLGGTGHTESFGNEAAK